ncbi:hypothetical protein [Achromobacter arsenitoxydans]|uniref:Uncharacterized protein n=1 Tax=Achromobacter arsenitoxydans SY8 TaxID=477184 RepID=H0F5E2_9BURK|nr:hypothetical protein [Achromobacter arsenitoxydans]EHK66456.1 hypothetical protein KYC_09926 [Achromobacter arsenitoxydans SY8]
MPQSAARTIEGRIDQLRLAVPQHRKNVFLRIGAETIWAIDLDPAHISDLRACHMNGIAVRVGVLEAGHGQNRFCWAVPARGKPIPPISYQTAQRRSGREAAIGGAVGAAALGAAWLAGLDTMARMFLMVFALVVALIALILAGYALFALWHNRRERPRILAAEALYDPARRPAATPAGPPSPPSRPEPAALRDEGAPPILHVRGRLDGITHESRHVHKGPSYGHYRFSVGGRNFMMTVDESLGSWQPFLAQDDRVEMAAHASPEPGQPHAVYALRNLEDGRNYMCHLRFRSGLSGDTPIGVGMNQRGPMLKMIGALMLTAWLILVGISWFSDGDASAGNFPEVATFILAMFFLVWLGFALPLLWLDTRWRMGRPTRRQRMTERIYAMLDLGTPFAPTRRIEEV